MSCPLCVSETQTLIYQTPEYRVVWADDTPLHPLFIRVIWQAHVREMSQLSSDQAQRLMAQVWRIEQAFLQLPAPLTPHKINLASLGNQVPHMHWHVIARYSDDAHFPAPIWNSINTTDAESQLAKVLAQRRAARTQCENWLLAQP